jgi:hypothetical protein
MKRYIAIFVLTIVSLIFIGRTSVLSNELKATNEKLASVEQELNDYLNTPAPVIEVEDSLTEWDVFTLALMKVESEYKPTAVSSVGAKGYFQIMPIYVEEVNRVHKTNYVYEDVVRSFELSNEVFILMQEAHNKDFSMDKALVLHNGDHKWYKKRVYNAMEDIERYEEMRQMVKDANMSLI